VRFEIGKAHREDDAVKMCKPFGGYPAHYILTKGFEPPGNLTALREWLTAIHPDFANLKVKEVDEPVLYGGVTERLEQAGIASRTAYEPRSTPLAQI